MDHPDVAIDGGALPPVDRVEDVWDSPFPDSALIAEPPSTAGDLPDGPQPIPPLLGLPDAFWPVDDSHGPVAASLDDPSTLAFPPFETDDPDEIPVAKAGSSAVEVALPAAFWDEPDHQSEAQFGLGHVQPEPDIDVLSLLLGPTIEIDDDASPYLPPTPTAGPTTSGRPDNQPRAARGRRTVALVAASAVLAAVVVALGVTGASTPSAPRRIEAGVVAPTVPAVTETHSTGDPVVSPPAASPVASTEPATVPPVVPTASRAPARPLASPTVTVTTPVPDPVPTEAAATVGPTPTDPPSDQMPAPTSPPTTRRSPPSTATTEPTPTTATTASANSTTTLPGRSCLAGVPLRPVVCR